MANFALDCMPLSKKVLASPAPAKEEKRETASQTTCFAVKKRMGLLIMPRSEKCLLHGVYAKGGRKKMVRTDGYFCPNHACEHYGIMEAEVHALVGYGTHGTQEVIRYFKCQACGKKFTARRNTIPYRLKSQSGLIEKILWLLALGVDASALEEVFEVREITIRAWLCRSGMQGKKLHERFMTELEHEYCSVNSSMDRSSRLLANAASTTETDSRS